MNDNFVFLFIAGSRDARRIACIVELQLAATDKVCTRSQIVPFKGEQNLLLAVSRCSMLSFLAGSHRLPCLIIS